MNLKSLPTLFVQAALVATAGALALVLVTKYVAPIPFSVSQTTTQKESSFNVTGKSTISATPDKAVVTLGISLKENDIKQAQSKANDTINAIIQKLGQLGINKDDIKTENYSIYPNYDYQNQSQNILGYSVNVSLQVNITDFAKLNQVIDSAVSFGANQVGGVEFTLSDAKEKEVRKEARAQAIDDAKANAAELAGLAGMRLGRVINISEGTNTPVPLPMMAMSKPVGVGGGGAPTDIQPGSTTYNYTVTLSYETL